MKFYVIGIDDSREQYFNIVGAGPGDPDLVSVKERHFLETAGLILYAGNLVPVELTYCAKQDAVVRSSAFDQYKMSYHNNAGNIFFSSGRRFSKLYSHEFKHLFRK
jgi:precorrin-4 methylase